MLNMTTDPIKRICNISKVVFNSIAIYFEKKIYVLQWITVIVGQLSNAINITIFFSSSNLELGMV